MSTEIWREKYTHMHTYIDTLMERETEKRVGKIEKENFSNVLDSPTSP